MPRCRVKLMSGTQLHFKLAAAVVWRSTNLRNQIIKKAFSFRHWLFQRPKIVVQMKCFWKKKWGEKLRKNTADSLVICLAFDFLGKWKGFRLFCYLLCPLVYRARFLNPDRIVDEHSLNDVLDVTRDKNWKNKSAGSQEKMRRKKMMCQQKPEFRFNSLKKWKN